MQNLFVYIKYYLYTCLMVKEKKTKLAKMLVKKNKSVYGMSQVLGVSPQMAEYIVKKMDLAKGYDRLKKIADYLECEIEEIV